MLTQDKNHENSTTIQSCVKQRFHALTPILSGEKCPTNHRSEPTVKEKEDKKMGIIIIRRRRSLTLLLSWQSLYSILASRPKLIHFQYKRVWHTWMPSIFPISPKASCVSLFSLYKWNLNIYIERIFQLLFKNHLKHTMALIRNGAFEGKNL